MDHRLGYRPPLDGLRAFAIAFVIGYHAFRTPSAGWLGVDLFFVLSGFLITTLLLEERARSGTVSLPAFYLRRAYRLLPALLVVLGIYGCVLAVQGRFTSSTALSLVMGIGYVMNLSLAGWIHSAPVALGHLWSLAEEEQFYLLWPPLLFLVIRGRQRLALSFLLVAVALVQIQGWNHASGAEARVLFAPDTRGLGILVGCVAAIVLSLWPARTMLIARVAWPLAAVVMAGLAAASYGSAMFRGGLLVYSCACALLIVAVLSARLPESFLSIPPLVFVGRISYSLYLWHLPVFVAFGVIQAKAFAVGSPGTKLAALSCTFVAATASYYLVELPFLRRKNRAGRTMTMATAPKVRVVEV